MLNKELLMTLTPTEEDGIFYVTFEKYTIGPISTHYTGYAEDDGTGEFYDKSEEYIIKGENNEVFKGKPISLKMTFQYISLTMRAVHTPNLWDTFVYLHIKYDSGEVESFEFYFDLNESIAYADSLGYMWNPVANQRIYLGPSPTPPHISRRYLRRILKGGSLC